MRFQIYLKSAPNQVVITEGFDEQDAKEKALAEFGSDWTGEIKEYEPQTIEYFTSGNVVYETLDDGSERFVAEWPNDGKAEDMVKKLNARLAS